MIEANQSELVVVGQCRHSGRDVQMCNHAAIALGNLIARARADGVEVVPISGFRTIAYQGMLFDRAVAKYGSESAAERWVARPGNSEHHTGLAVDLGDGGNPAADVEPMFEKTKAFEWLGNNAMQFGFEMSFPKNNLLGVNYEPWHWRFVGTPEAKQIFKR